MPRHSLFSFLLLIAALPVVAQERVKTANGTVQGVALPGGIRLFKGLPFAAPPVRDLRWKPPQPVANWQGIRAADRFAPQCMQTRVYADMVFRNDGTSEDCLYLNVWAPVSSSTARLPVLVYFYGGGFTAGDGSEPRYDGEHMAQKGMVVVTTSYRLGIFGYFSHPELSKESPQHASGNYGLMDQVASLRWVKDNIGAFGGDPSRVTIAGESAGSFSVSGVMASPMAKGLFAGAIGESGAFFGATLSAAPQATTEQNGTRFMTMAGAQSLADLRAFSAHEILDWSGRQGLPRFQPNIDGAFLPESPTAIFAAGKQAKVPLLAGWNSEEQAGRSLAQTPSVEAFTASLNRIFSTRAEEALKVLPHATPTEIMESATALASDQFTGYGTWKWLDEQARAGQPVYRYYFSRARPASTGGGRGGGAAGDATNPWNSFPRGAAHASEIEYALGNLDRNPVYAWTDDDRKVSATMMEYFANFVKTGNPNEAGLPAWPVGRPDANGNVMRLHIDVETRAEPEPRARYLFLQSFYDKR